MGIFSLLKMRIFSLFNTTDINEGVQTCRKTDGAVLLDVRSAEEYKAGHIAGSVNIPVADIHTAPDRIPDKNTVIFSYCLRGSRSARAVRILRNLGYTKVTNIGGIAAYQGEVTQGSGD